MTTHAPAFDTATAERNAPLTEQWSVSTTAAYQILPGVATLLLFVPLMWGISGTTIPGMVALFVAILFGEVPVSWYLMMRTLKAEGRAVTVANLFPWRERPGPARLLFVGLGLALLGMVIVFGLAMTAEPVIQRALFAWVPEWLILRAGPEAIMGASRAGLMAVWALSGVVGIGIGGLTQELYHRGFILPRSAHFGWLAVPLNATFFAIVHLSAPWGWPFFFLASALWGAAVYHWKSIQMGLAGHIGMLALGWLMMTGIVFGLIPMP